MPIGEVIACGLDHQGESVLAWDAESGKPLSPIVVWQDKRSQEILDQLGDDEDEVQKLQRPALRSRTSRRRSSPGCSSTTRPSSRRATRPARCAWAPSTRFLCDRLGAGFATDAVDRLAHAAAHARHARASTPRLCEIFGVPPDVLPEVRDTAGELGTLRHESLAGRAAAARPGRRPAGRARRRRLRRARPRQGDLRDGRLRARPRRRRGARSPPAGCCPPSPGASTARSSTRSTAASSRPARCSSGCASELGLAEDPPALSKLAREADGSAGARVLPGARRARRPVVAARTRAR